VPSTKNGHADTNDESGLSVQVNLALTKSQVIAGLRRFAELLETAPDDLGEWEEWIKEHAREFEPSHGDGENRR
jgi:hypothetical protein